MSEIKFSDGMPVRERRSDTDIYPEELLDKKCGGCVRCQPRKRKGETGYHCTTQPYTKDISPEDKACVIYWDKEEERKYKALKAQDNVISGYPDGNDHAISALRYAYEPLFNRRGYSA